VGTRSVVHWECQAPEHRALRSRHGNGGLTIHEGAWAYCDGAAADEAHRWSATGGVPIEALVRWSAPNGEDPAPVTLSGAPVPGAATKTARKTAGIRRA
jgi:hypothetical protein